MAAALLPSALMPSVNYLKMCPDYNELSTAIGRDVSVVIGTTSFSYCVLRSRKVVLAPSEFKSKVDGIYPKVIESIVFEMNNLAQAERFHSLLKQARNLTPEDFVMNYEKIEHQTALRTKRSVRQIFPERIWRLLPIAFASENFSHYYLLQQVDGHSERIWKRFSSHFPTGSYLGSWRGPMIEAEKAFLSHLFLILAYAEDSDPAIRENGKCEYFKARNTIIQKAERGIRCFPQLANRVKEFEALVEHQL